ncbi:hypothetical protein ACM43_04905 [Bradyrhizobium sp. CCBAU 45321]|nr:hypothetical protein [Bradyrhizobium sp. CCBAU 45321]
MAHVHAGFSVFSTLAMQMLINRGVPFVVSPHGKLTKGMLAKRRQIKMWWWWLLERRLVNGASAVGVFSQNESAYFDRLGIDRPIRIIPNGVNAPSLQDVPEVSSVSEPYLLFFGYLDPRKQPDLLIRSYAATTAARKSHLLAFVGPDAYGLRSKLENVTATLRLTERVRFLGPAYNGEKWSLLRNATAVLLPSLAEGMPLALLEAACVGTPTVFSKECNAQLISDAKAGVEAADFDEMTWAAAMDRIVSQSDDRKSMAKNALELSKSFSWSNISSRWLDLYTDLEGGDHG